MNDNLLGFQTMQSPFAPRFKTETVEVERGLTMLEQWRRWGLNFWRYRETETVTVQRQVEPRQRVVYMMHNQIVAHPENMGIIKTMLA